MDFQVTSAKVFGDSEGGGWVQVHDFTPSDNSKLLSRGRLFAVVSGRELFSEDKKELDKVLVGREILTRFHEEYYGKTEGSAFVALKNAVKQLHREFSEGANDIEITVAVYIDGVIYCATAENSFVSLYRNGALVKILQGRSGQTSSASGHPETGDVLVLGSGDFSEHVDDSLLKDALRKKELEDIKESIIPSIRSLEDGSRSGAVFIKFNEKEGQESVSTFAPSEEINKPENIKTDSSEATETVVPNNLSIKERLLSKLPQRNIQIKGQEIDEAMSKRRRMAVSVGLILLVLLLVSIVFGIRTKKESDRRELFEDTISEATHQLEEAVNLYELNPIRSRELFNQSKNKVESLVEDEIDYPEVDELRDKISENEAKILGEYRIEPDLFLDLTLLSEGFYGSGSSLSEDMMIILDTDNKRLVSVEVDTKRTEVIAGDDDLNDPRGAAVYSGRFFVLDGSTVYEIDRNDKDEVEEGFGGDDLIASFAGNIYVLSKNDSQVYRIAGSNDGFSEKSEWLSEGTEPDFSEIVAWSIDGNIWVLLSDGEILRYSLGNEINFNIEGVFPPVDSGASIFTDEDSQYLYILEPENERIVVSDKDGDYVAQYISSDFGQGRSVTVSESEKKMIILTGEKLLSIELKHLE